MTTVMIPNISTKFSWILFVIELTTSFGFDNDILLMLELLMIIMIVVAAVWIWW